MLKEAASSPKQTPRHVRGHGEHDESCAREMLRAEDRQGDGETQIAQGYDLVQAAGPRDIGLCSPQRNNEKQDAGAARQNHRGRDLKKSGENGCVHVDAKPKLACSILALSGPESRFWFQQRAEVYAHPKAFSGIKVRPPVSSQCFLHTQIHLSLHIKMCIIVFGSRPCLPISPLTTA